MESGINRRIGIVSIDKSYVTFESRWFSEIDFVTNGVGDVIKLEKEVGPFTFSYRDVDGNMVESEFRNVWIKRDEPKCGKGIMNQIRDDAVTEVTLKDVKAAWKKIMNQDREYRGTTICGKIWVSKKKSLTAMCNDSDCVPCGNFKKALLGG